MLLELRGVSSPTEAPVADEENPDKNDDSEDYLVLEAAREVRISNRRRHWRTSNEGVSSARQEVSSLYASLERRVKNANKKLVEEEAPITISLSIENDDHFIISSDPYNLSITWDCKSDSTLEGSVPSIRGYKIGLKEEQYYTAEYDIEMNRDLVIGWRRREDKTRFISTDNLANELLRGLVGHIRSQAMYGE